MAQSYSPAPQVEELAQDIIREHHGHLVGIRIEYVFAEETAKSGGKEMWGRCRKLTGLNAFLATEDEDSGFSDEPGDPFFCIEIARPVWNSLSPDRRRALVEHELCHAGVELDKDGKERLVIWPHDVEEFSAVVARHGLWRNDVEAFVSAAKDGQKSLFDTIADGMRPQAGDGIESVTLSSGGKSVTLTAKEPPMPA